MQMAMLCWAIKAKCRVFDRGLKVVRDMFFDKSYFDKWVAFEQVSAIDPLKSTIFTLPRHEGRAQGTSDLCSSATRLAIMRYSRGDPIGQMIDSSRQMVDMLALKHEIMASIVIEPNVRHMWTRLDLSTLYENLTCLAFIVAQRFSPADQLQALALIGHAGEDSLLDHIAVLMGVVGRDMASQSKYPPVYDALLAVTMAAPDKRAALLKKYVDSWHRRMKPIYWHQSHKGSEGAYFGYWCFEAALVAMLLNIDDSALQDHSNYPSDLVKHYRATA